ncbi:MAG: O-antigen ligase family protein [Paludibacteraceae bacterium]|nr:O-antigen ligase family protein [Paludibacteraceae bacterium]
MQIKKENIAKWGLNILLLIYALMGAFIMEQSETTTQTAGGLMYYFVVANFCSIIYSFFLLKDFKIKKQSIYIWLYICFFVVALICDTFHLSGLSDLIYISTPLFSLYVVYIYSRTHTLDISFHTSIFIGFLILCIQYLQIYNISNLFYKAHLTVAYYPMYFFPLVMLNPNKRLRAIATFIILLVIVSSIKRGGILSFSLGLIAYLFVQQRNDNKSNTKKLFIIIITIAVATAIVLYLITLLQSNIFDRFASISSDGGSNRIPLWKHVITMISKSNVYDFIIGHGHNSVVAHNYLYGVSAHNDFLEIQYDYGFISFVLYISAFAGFIIKTRKLIKEKSQYAPTIAMMSVMYFIMSNISVIVIYFQFIYVMIFYAIVIGQTENNGQK